MTRPAIACILALIVASFCLGALLAGHPPAALAQDKPADGDKPAAGGEPAADVKAIITPPAVVSAIPYVSKTDFEQDPFEPTRLRRTQTTVVKVLMVRADGTTEIKDPN